MCVWIAPYELKPFDQISRSRCFRNRSDKCRRGLQSYRKCCIRVVYIFPSLQTAVRIATFPATALCSKGTPRQTDRSQLFISQDKGLLFLPQYHAAAQSPQVDSLRTTWRLHPIGDTTVWEADCFFLEASVGQFLRWERSLDSADEADNPFAPFDR